MRLVMSVLGGSECTTFHCEDVYIGLTFKPIQGCVAVYEHEDYDCKHYDAQWFHNEQQAVEWLLSEYGLSEDVISKILDESYVDLTNNLPYICETDDLWT